MIVRKFHGLEEFLATFILAVLFHGAYDAIILIPGWQDYAIINLIWWPYWCIATSTRCEI